MKLDHQSLRPFATFAAGLFILVACQNATDSNVSESGPMKAYATFNPSSPSRFPDSANWTSKLDAGTGGLHCDGIRTCTDTLSLKDALGSDTATLRLWALGIRLVTLRYTQIQRSPDLTYLSIESDSLDLRLLDAFYKLHLAKGDSLNKAGTPKASLVSYYASLVILGDTSFKGKPLPVGMIPDSVHQELVYWGFKSNWTVKSLTGLNLDTGFIRTAVSNLIKQGALNSSDSSALFPPYPIRVSSPISVNGSLTVGGNAVSVSGAFAWTKGKFFSPTFEVHTSKGVDPNFNFIIATLPSRTDVIWILDSNLTIQAKPLASAGTDTLVVTLSNDSGYFATSRTVFQVVAKDVTPPVLKITSPSKDTIVPNGTGSILVAAIASDSGSGLDSVKIGLSKHTTSPFSDSVILAVGANPIIVQAWDKAGNSSTQTVVVTRAQAVGDTVPPTLKITSPLKDTTVPNSVAFFVVTATASDSGSGIASVQIGNRPPRAVAPFSDTVYLVSGIDTIVVKALDNAGNKTSATIHVTRTPTAVVIAPPKVQHVSPSLDTTVGWEAKSISLSWIVTDDSAYSVFVNGSILTSKSALFQTSQNLAVGVNTFTLVAMDGHGTSKTDTIHVIRLADTTKPVVSRGGASRDTVVLKNSTPFNAAWTVTDNALMSVTIGGTSVSSSSNLYSSTVTLSGDSTWVVLVAIDSSRDTTRDSIKVRRLEVPTITPNGASLSGDQTTTVSITANLPRATISYSTNRTSWDAYSTSLSISKSQILYAKATLNGVSTDIDSAVFLYTPSLPASGPMASGQTITITAPGAAIEDSSSTGTSWISYTNPIQLNASTEIYARSRLGTAVSSYVSGIYVLSPVISPNPPAQSYVDTITARASDPGADFIQWSTDNSSWTTGSSHLFTANGTFYARSSLGGIVSTSASVALAVKHDTTLKALTISGTTVTITGTILTMDSLPGLTTQMAVVASPNDPMATVVINGGNSGIISFANGIATASVVVTNGTSTLTYTITLKEKHLGTFTDARDGQIYRAVLIGNQWWMAQNLNYDTATNTSSWCFNDSTAYCSHFGRLYDWLTSMSAGTDALSKNWTGIPLRQGVCPTGWHVPSTNEWTTLAQTVGGTGGVSIAAKKLKSNSEWPTPGTNDFGFNLLPSGEKNPDGSYSSGDARYWTSIASSTKTNFLASLVDIQNGSDAMTESPSIYSNSGFSIRCAKN